MRHFLKSAVFVCVLLLIFACGSWANDWPQWRGPNRDAVCSETGLLKEWPAEGPKLLWEISGLGPGFSTVSIVGGTLYTMGDREVNGEKGQYVYAYDLDTRRELWAARVGPSHRDGPRGTPTVAGGFVYAIGTSGDVVCIAADSGKVIWTQNLLDDLGLSLIHI